jgi:Mn-dependent DtxR family transcriptional regulator
MVINSRFYWLFSKIRNVHAGVIKRLLFGILIFFGTCECGKVWSHPKLYPLSPLHKDHMVKDEGLELTPRKVGYLRYLSERGGCARTTEIAAHFGVDPSTITKTIAELADTGYLQHTPYHGVSLTNEGEKYAAFLVKRHRILSLILVRNGLSGEDACREVSRFESFISRNAIDTMCRAMGHPQLGTCGKITHDDRCMANASLKRSAEKRRGRV